MNRPITFDSTDLFSADGMFVSRITKGAPRETPMFRGEDDTVAGRVGRVPYPRVADVLPIGILIQLQAPAAMSTAESLVYVETKRRQLLALFTPSAPRVLSTILVDGSIATVNADVLPPVLVKDLMAETLPGLVLQLDLALESVDPAWVITAP